jgi:NAD(P)-dependent dehydrogenase (short-subunit alcohol dehydrogenase family)
MRAQGYNVVGVDIEKPTQDDDRIRGDNFHFVQADVGVVTEAERIVQESVQRYGDKVHVLINNAGKVQVWYQSS